MLPPTVKTNQGLLPAGLEPPAALYIHVPFCLRKCRYCNFYSEPMDSALAGRYVRAALAEMETQRHLLSTPLKSVFVGGGTPTALPAEMLGQLLAPAAALIDESTEFSIEANPGTIDAAMVDILVRSGVNRVSLGVQSLQDSELELLGRIHTSAQAKEAVRLVRRGGIANISVDLIYAVPGQTMESWRSSLAQALDLGVEHLSCYALSFEEPTELWRDLQGALVREMDDSAQRELYDAARQAAGQAGMQQYEISNFALPGRQCLHNITYWRNRQYVGVGPAAASYVDLERRTTCADLEAYLRAMEAGQSPPATAERLDDRDRLAEAMMLGLRMTQGIDRGDFAEIFGADPAEAFPRSISRYAGFGALIVTPTHIRVAEQYLFVCDTILADILDEA